MDPRGGTKGPPSPDEHPPPSPPVRQGDSASLPSLFHLATSKIPSAPQGAAYLVLLVTWIIDPWFIRMLGINYLSAHSHSLIRLSLVFLFDILDPASVRYMLHRLHHCLSILSSHHHYLSEALTLVISVFLVPKARCLLVTPPNKPLTEPVFQYYIRSFIYMLLLLRHHDLHLRDSTGTLY